MVDHPLGNYAIECALGTTDSSVLDRLSVCLDTQLKTQKSRQTETAIIENYNLLNLGFPRRRSVVCKYLIH